jgi:hypothetical protein
MDRRTNLASGGAFPRKKQYQGRIDAGCEGGALSFHGDPETRGHSWIVHFYP